MEGFRGEGQVRGPSQNSPAPLQHTQIALTCKNHNAFEYSLKITKFTLIIEQLLDRIKNQFLSKTKIYYSVCCCAEKPSTFEFLMFAY